MIYEPYPYQRYCAARIVSDAAVGLFLENKIPFGQIPKLVERALDKIPVQLNPGLEDILEADRAARQVVCDSRKDG